MRFAAKHMKSGLEVCDHHAGVRVQIDDATSSTGYVLDEAQSEVLTETLCRRYPNAAARAIPMSHVRSTAKTPGTVTIRCPQCNGLGETRGFTVGRQVCSRCGGDGEITGEIVRR